MSPVKVKVKLGKGVLAGARAVLTLERMKVTGQWLKY